MTMHTVSDVIEKYLRGSGKLYRIDGTLPDGTATDVKVRADNAKEADKAADILFKFFRGDTPVLNRVRTRIAQREIK